MPLPVHWGTREAGVHCHIPTLWHHVDGEGLGTVARGPYNMHEKCVALKWFCRNSVTDKRISSVAGSDRGELPVRTESELRSSPSVCSTCRHVPNMAVEKH